MHCSMQCSQFHVQFSFFFNEISPKYLRHQNPYHHLSSVAVCVCGRLTLSLTCEPILTIVSKFSLYLGFLDETSRGDEKR